MRGILSIVCAVAFAMGVSATASAGDKAEKAAKKPAAAAKGEVTLKGSMVCGKCSLSETKSCQNVLKVAEAGKETKYYLADNAVAKENHGPVCSGAANATVKGTVKDEAGKKVLTASEIKYE